MTNENEAMKNNISKILNEITGHFLKNIKILFIRRISI
tara:strand:+ start:921 stop:1034 length:114 start_codon:yes stop_codon:yes gene_type:complete